MPARSLSTDGRNLMEMTAAELHDWVRQEVTAQTHLLREQVEVLRRGLDVLVGQIEHQQRILQLVGSLAAPVAEG